MRLRLIRELPALHRGVEKLRARLPPFAAKFLYAPAHRIFRESSLSEDLERISLPVGLPSSYSIDPRIPQAFRGIHSFRRAGGSGVEMLHLADATVLSHGIIIHRGAIQRCSSVYSRLNLDQILAAAREYHDGENRRPALDSATIVSRQFVNEGTWGDYFLEFLMPMAWVPPRPGRTVLCDCDFVSKYAGRESQTLGFECRDIPAGGIRVRDLEVIGPCQVFNNFEEANLSKLRERFPARPDRMSPKRVYLSRLGVVSDNTKISRFISNEEEVAGYLKSEGFEILHAHEMDGDEMRGRIAGAEVIVGCWGAAMLNAAWARPKTVIELVSERIWSPTALKMSLANGVERHTAIRATDHRISIEELSKALEQASA